MNLASSGGSVQEDAVTAPHFPWIYIPSVRKRIVDADTASAQIFLNYPSAHIRERRSNSSATSFRTFSADFVEVGLTLLLTNAS
jgi:hypothetical protein